MTGHARIRFRRREFLHAAAGGVALLGCHGAKRDPNPPEPDLIPGLNPGEREILDLASLAPSGHNTQPWGVRVEGPGRWTITSDRRRWLPAVDPEQRETVLSIGAFLENLVVAAGHYGFETELKGQGQSAQDPDLVAVTLTKGTPRPGPIEEIRGRRVVRKGYLATELRPDDVRHLTSGRSDRCHFFPPGSPQGRYLDDGTVEANRAQAARDPAEAELADWIRWSDDDARRERDGLTPEAMEITGLSGWYVRHFYDRQDAMSEDFREKTVATAVEQVKQHGGWLVVTSPGGSVADLLATGRLFEQLFLVARARMIAIHPMTQLLEEAPWQREVATALGLADPIQFILRTGYLERYPAPVSLRRPPKWFVQA